MVVVVVLLHMKYGPSLGRDSAQGKYNIACQGREAGDQWSFLLKLHKFEKCIALAVAKIVSDK